MITPSCFCVEENSKSVPKIIEKNSVVVMHALDRIVETLNRNYVDMGLFFAWSPDGSRIGTYTISDRSVPTDLCQSHL